MQAHWLWGVAASFMLLAPIHALAAEQDDDIKCYYDEDKNKYCYQVSTGLPVYDPVSITGTPPDDDERKPDDWAYRKLFENPNGNPRIGDSGGGGSGNPSDGIFVIEGPVDCTSAQTEFGNPIEPATGAKIEVEVDFATQGEVPLFLRRTYSSVGRTGMFGTKWLTNFDQSLLVPTDRTVLTAYRNDGSQMEFKRNDATSDWRDVRGGPARVVESASGFLLYGADNIVETYGSSGGKILTRKNRRGVGLTYHYALYANLPLPTVLRLERVTHTSGREIRFHWGKTGLDARILQVDDPAGNAYSYRYDHLGRLESVKSAGSLSLETVYHYGSDKAASRLLGKSIAGVRYSTFKYDLQARAISTEHADGADLVAPWSTSNRTTMAITRWR